MKKCFICEENDSATFSLEHSIPQFLFGGLCPDKFKKQTLCKTCNSNLGLHVDGMFSKSFFIATELEKIKPKKLVPFTAICRTNHQYIYNIVGIDKTILILLNDLCSAFWINERDDKYNGLIGGNPIKNKKDTKLFVFINETEENNEFNALFQTLQNIKNQYGKLKKMEILICANIETLDTNYKLYNQFLIHIEKNFSKKVKFLNNFSDEDKELAHNLRQILNNGEGFQTDATINLNHYTRFLAKLFLGFIVGYVGVDFEKSNLGIKLIKLMTSYNTICPEEDIKRVTFPGFRDETVKKLFEKTGSVNIAVTKHFGHNDIVVGVLAINEFTVMFEIGKISDFSIEELSKLKIDNGDFSGIIVSIRPNHSKVFEELPLQQYLLNTISNEGVGLH